MPKRLPRAGVKSKKIAFDIAGEGEPARRGQDSRTWRPTPQVMRPTDLARLIIDRLDHALTPQTVIGAGPAVGTIRGFGEINGVAGVGGDDEQSGLGVETGRSKVGHPTLVRRYQAPVGRWFLSRVGNRTPLLVNPKRPVNGPKWNREQALAVGSIEHEKITVARTL